MLKYASLAFFVSFFLCLLFIAGSKKIRLFLTDHLHLGPQTFHTRPTPRLGGLGIFAGTSLGLLFAYLVQKTFYYNYLLLILCSFPVFLVGLFEDITGILHPKIRLIILAFSSVLAFFFLNAKITRVDLPLADTLLKFAFVSLAFTVFALVGISNAINIIDGFNGLASMVSMMIFMAISYVAYKLGDYEIATLCTVSTFALLGFFLLNYPFGLIFLGDGGAYFTGFLIGISVVLLVYKHSEVSPWFALTVNIYPVYETLFSIYRKKILRKLSPMQPDGLHFHMLIYKILIKRFLNLYAPEVRNPLTSVFLWIINALAIVPALLFWNNTNFLILCCIFFSVFYTYLYWKIIKMRKITVN
ncbi:MAG: UDP-N-acetylmuramyl pentapeptide phosphotransferase/UDP-N-acetylglucosamine-1-phosphate transferase [Thermodesulfobacterium sp.]|uniref:UDP-N-acetylmuramyl pentapeptide phosphotransferase/UDP-N-acetylglucosamine-1-phosphate transferase n=1 Tax=Candidatus Thermodesulfobacterium syntrophicum TaxID=3060442 RepID=A0AAE3P578_9BACT|nr:UDP-N-acetylmuramyl pentapeptide phosphotransferase/UDP-N-acetylglucosamine-1-phosphate transferase [Candidatus Thermodesulfobacterium syntrophicum]